MSPHLCAAARVETGMEKNGRTGTGASITQEDFQWFMASPFFDEIPDEAKYHLFTAIRPVLVSEGETFIKQGTPGDSFYIVRRGKCAANRGVDGLSQLVGRMGPGDIVGEMAILSGAPRTADVVAETDMELWEIERATFDKNCVEFPQLRQFLTRITARRLESEFLTSNRVVGKYSVDEAIGQGSFSYVYKGRHTAINMPVAIKMLKHERAVDPAFIELFRNEAGTIAQLNHENIVKVYDVEEIYRTFFIVMEYVEGKTLALLLARSDPRPPEGSLGFLLQICAGLNHAHERGVVHRDVKPGNIIITPDGRVRIFDFGLACAPGITEDLVKGTLAYISPEQIGKKPIDARSDIYSLGMTAYEMFTGRRACPAGTIEEQISWQLEAKMKDPRALNPELPDRLVSVLFKATKKDPDKRYQSVSEMIRDLEPIARSMGVPATGESDETLNMMSLFVFYRSGRRDLIRRLVNEFGRELEKVGASFRGSDYKDVDRGRPRSDSD